MSAKRFSLALSFPGQYLEYVKKVDTELMKLFTPDNVFFDDGMKLRLPGWTATQSFRKYIMILLNW